METILSFIEFKYDKNMKVNNLMILVVKNHRFSGKPLRYGGDDASDYLGVSVSISYNYIIVGAYGDEDNGHESGNANIFELNKTTMILGKFMKLLSSNGGDCNFFGYSVSIDGIYDLAIVVAPLISQPFACTYIYQRINNYNDSGVNTCNETEILDEFDTTSAVRSAIANENDTKLQDSTTTTINKDKNTIKISKRRNKNTSTNILKFASKSFANYTKELAMLCARNDTATASKIDINYTLGGNSYKITPLQAVCEHGNLEIVQLFMNIVDAQGNTPVFSCLSSPFSYTIFTRIAMLAPDSEFQIRIEYVNPCCWSIKII